MIARLYSLNKQFINLNGKLLALPKLKAFIMDALGYGWDRNRAIDSKGNHNNALMGGYLLAASNTTITISGLLTTDTLLSLTTNGLVGTIATNNIISFTTGNNYGAFEVYRGNLRIGRYCLTERQGLQIINQVTGGLPSGLLGGTTTTVWQKSNAFYCETNHTGYSISGTEWVTSAGEALTVGTIVPADQLNPTKCMAWVGGVQQDLQFVGKARNSMSVVPLTSFFNGDRGYKVQLPAYNNITEHKIECIFLTTAVGAGGGLIYGMHGDLTNGALGRCRQILVSTSELISCTYILPDGNRTDLQVAIKTINRPLKAIMHYKDGRITLTVTDLLTQYSVVNSRQFYTSISLLETQCVVGAVVIPNTSTDARYAHRGYIASVTESVNGVAVFNMTNNQHGTSIYDTITKSTLPPFGFTTNLLQNIDLVYNAFNQTGYELWYNGTDYRIYPLASDGTRIITPAGYTLVETVTAGNMPSIADSRFTTFKYALANSYAVRQSVPEAFDTTDPCAPKLLTYSELSALGNNDKVFITESNGKITNIKAT